MEDHSASSGDSVSIQNILDALDTDCRTILRAAAEPTTATELLEMCSIPRSTLYRKLDLLCQTSLLRVQESVSTEGGRTKRYERDFDSVVITIDEDEFVVTVEHPERKSEEQLEALWAELRDEV